MTKKGAQVIGISTDDVATLKSFKEKLGAPFPLLSDPGGKVAKQYAGLMPVVGLATRSNIVLGKDGVVKEVVTGGDAVDPSTAIASCPSAGGGS